MGYNVDYTLEISGHEEMTRELSPTEVMKSLSFDDMSFDDLDFAISDNRDKEVPIKIEDIMETVHEMSELAECYCYLELDGSSGGGEKQWTEMEEIFVKISALYEDVLMTITCVGEQGEHWRHYFRNGKTYQAAAEIVHPEFEEGYLG